MGHLPSLSTLKYSSGLFHGDNTKSGPLRPLFSLQQTRQQEALYASPPVRLKQSEKSAHKVLRPILTESLRSVTASRKVDKVCMLPTLFYLQLPLDQFTARWDLDGVGKVIKKRTVPTHSATPAGPATGCTP